MNNRSILYFLEKSNDDLLPSDAMVSNIANKEWYQAVKPFFNDLLWEYYSDRIVFIDNRFKCDDDANTLINKIKKSFAILLKTKDYTFEKMYNVTQLEYNPIWNVDGVVGTIHETTGNESIGTTKTGSDTTSHTGDDTLKHTGNDTDAKTGTEKFDTTNDGDTTETDTQRYTSTYDSIDFTPPAEYPSSHDHVKNTENKHDTTTFNTSNQTTYNSNDKTEYNSETEVEYDTSEDTSKEDFRRDLDLMIRQGNIGVTMTQDMMKKELEVALFDFYKTVVHECVNTCTYAID